MCSATVILKRDVLICSATFSWLPHTGISLFINKNASGDADLSCHPTNKVLGKVVNYTCNALNPSIKSIKAQVAFCDIEFNSSILNITIKELGKITAVFHNSIIYCNV